MTISRRVFLGAAGAAAAFTPASFMRSLPICSPSAVFRRYVGSPKKSETIYRLSDMI